MQVTVDIPDELASRLSGSEAVSRQMLEAFAADGYRREILSRKQVGLLLGLDRWQTEDFLVERNAIRPFGAADYEVERAAK